MGVSERIRAGWGRWVWLCPLLALALAAGILVLWGVTLWTAIGVALLLVCPAIIVWAMLDLARDEARDQRLDEIRRKQKP